VIEAIFLALSPTRKPRDRTGQRKGVMARLEMSTYETIETAAAGGTPDALFELGLMCCAGRDVELDLVSAHQWFNLAAMRGNADAKRYRMEIAREMSNTEIAEAQRRARQWIARH
jgi:TPR repeat protein